MLEYPGLRLPADQWGIDHLAIDGGAFSDDADRTGEEFEPGHAMVD